MPFFQKIYALVPLRRTGCDIIAEVDVGNLGVPELGSCVQSTGDLIRWTSQQLIPFLRPPRTGVVFTLSSVCIPLSVWGIGVVKGFR